MIKKKATDHAQLLVCCYSACYYLFHYHDMISTFVVIKVILLIGSLLSYQELTAKLVASQTKGKKDMVNKIEYTEEGNGKVAID